MGTKIPKAARRRGVSLLIVMVTISVTVVLTYSLLRTQTTTLQLSRNSARRDLALQAAQAGASVALRTMQSSSWGGVTQVLTGTASSDGEGTATYRVQFLPLTSSTTIPESVWPLHLVVRSVGTWRSAINASEQVQRTVEVVARLEARVPGRAIRSGDSASASDVRPNPNDFDQIQTYAVFGSASGTTLASDPGVRLEGTVWLRDNLNLFHQPSWSGSIRQTVLSQIAGRYRPSGSFLHPHPFSGSVVFSKTPSGSVKDDLTRLGVGWTTSGTAPIRPAVNYADWDRYRLYDGGFEYQAQPVGSVLEGVTLRPSATNPLGIFTRTGSVRIGNNVTVQGTLIVNGTLTIDGASTCLGTYNWRADGGTVPVTGLDKWPRLPVIVAKDIIATTNCRAILEGAVIAENRLTGNAARYGSGWDVWITGTATSAVDRQPNSVVQLLNRPSLSEIDGSGNYAIWLADGTSGNWFPITAVDRTNYRLTVQGEAQRAAAVDYLIRRARTNSLDIRGPISAERVDLNGETDWNLSSYLWDDRYSDWTDLNTDRARQGQSPINLMDWLANPFNYWFWPYPYWYYGLQLEPTVHLRNTSGVLYEFAPPLFRPYAGSGSAQDFSGYRWEVLSWREVAP